MPPVPKSSSQNLIVAVAILLAAGILALYFRIELLSNEVKILAAMTDRRISTAEQTLPTAVETNATTKSTTTNTPIQTLLGTDTSKWKTYKTGNFQFKYPNELTPTTSTVETTGTEIEMDFVDANNQRVFLLSCPIRAQGFEGGTYTEQKRSFSKNGKTFNVTLWLADPAEASLKMPHVVFVRDAQDQSYPEKPESSCEIMSDTGRDISKEGAIYQDIYKSIR